MLGILTNCQFESVVEPFYSCIEEVKENSELRNDLIIWHIGTQKDWDNAIDISQELQVSGGLVKPYSNSAILQTKPKKFNKKRTLKSIRVFQSPEWKNWIPIKKVTPKMAVDAPVFISVSDHNYWLLSMFKNDKQNGYHAWHSEDMLNWTHYGPVSSKNNKWVTSAEYVNDKFYIYFDKPNDEDPHLLIDSDLTDGKQGEEIGMVFYDPSHGSDMSIFRDEDGIFHLFYEDWSPINPRMHHYDSPLAGHTDSPDGINGFEPHEFPPPIDDRTTPTGEIRSYEPHSTHFIEGMKPGRFEYEVHHPAQNAYGDYELIKVGHQYYLFGDYVPKESGKTIRIGRWRSDDINKQFIWDGEIGENIHPDPTIGFAENKFYLITQGENDFISEGPWINGVEVQVGVDLDGDDHVDKWSGFVPLRENYTKSSCFSKVIHTIPAEVIFPTLEAAYSFTIRYKFSNENGFFPTIDSFDAVFD